MKALKDCPLLNLDSTLHRDLSKGVACGMRVPWESMGTRRGESKPQRGSAVEILYGQHPANRA